MKKETLLKILVRNGSGTGCKISKTGRKNPGLGKKIRILNTGSKSTHAIFSNSTLPEVKVSRVNFFTISADVSYRAHLCYFKTVKNLCHNNKFLRYPVPAVADKPVRQRSEDGSPLRPLHWPAVSRPVNTGTSPAHCRDHHHI